MIRATENLLLGWEIKNIILKCIWRMRLESMNPIQHWTRWICNVIRWMQNFIVRWSLAAILGWAKRALRITNKSPSNCSLSLSNTLPFNFYLCPIMVLIKIKCWNTLQLTSTEQIIYNYPEIEMIVPWLDILCIRQTAPSFEGSHRYRFHYKFDSVSVLIVSNSILFTALFYFVHFLWYTRKTKYNLLALSISMEPACFSLSKFVVCSGHWVVSMCICVEIVK